MPVHVQDEDGVVHVRLDRREAMNAIDDGLARDLDHALAVALAGRPRALVLSGEGRSFCAGGDIHFSRRMAEQQDGGRRVREEMLSTINRVVIAIDQAECVTIAALEGPVVGAGIGLALATDLRIMGRSGRFIPGWVKVSASPDAGGSYFLSQILPPRVMRSFLIRGNPLNAQRAHDLMIVDEVVEDGEATRRAIELGKDLGALSASSIRNVRALAALASTHDLSAHLSLEQELALQMRNGKERAGALGAWIEARAGVRDG